MGLSGLGWEVGVGARAGWAAARHSLACSVSHHADVHRGTMAQQGGMPSHHTANPAGWTAAPMRRCCPTASSTQSTTRQRGRKASAPVLLKGNALQALLLRRLLRLRLLLLVVGLIVEKLPPPPEQAAFIGRWRTRQVAVPDTRSRAWRTRVAWVRRSTGVLGLPAAQQLSSPACFTWHCSRMACLRRNCSAQPLAAC